MRKHLVTLREVILIAATRGMIGFGAGLLSTIPLALQLLRGDGNEDLRSA